LSALNEWKSNRPTQILFLGASFHELESRRNHDKQCHKAAKGNGIWTAHPPSPVVGQRDGNGQFVTKSLAAYHAALNQAIARIIADSLLRYDDGGPEHDSAS
jgi:hypothetical protein